MSFPRYPKYKDSGVEWLGEVPEHWLVLPAKRSFRRRKELNFGMKCENRLSLTLKGVVPRSLDDLEGLQASEFETYQIFHPNDLVFKLIDLQNIKTSRVGLVPEKGIMSPAYIRAEPDRSKVNPKYAFWFFMNLYNRCIFNELGGGVRQTISHEELLLLPFPRASMAEQTSIAAFLDRETAKIDELVAEQRRLMELLKEKRQAVISHAVTRGLNSDAPLKPSGIYWLGDVPEHWEVRRIRSISTFITSGPRGWSERVGDEGSLFIQSGDLNSTLGIEFANAKRVQVNDDAEASRTRLAEGDLVVCITGAKTGNVAVAQSVPEEAFVNQHLALVRPTADVLPAFLGAVLKGRPGQVHFDLSQYGLKQGLSLENVKEAPVPCPPIQEQTAIVDFIAETASRFDALTAEAQRAIDLLQERRTALISAAVTGQIDVRQLTPSR